MHAVSKFVLPALASVAVGAAVAASPQAPGTAINKQALTAAGADPQPAVWTTKDVQFLYRGITAKYTCDGLHDQVESVLRQLGARRADLKVRRSGCSPSDNAPQTLPGLDITMTVLQPASGAAGAEVIGAHWKLVDVKTSAGASNSGGDCELIEEVRRTLLPLFATRAVDGDTNCIPHQAGVGRPTLKVEVLVPDAEPAKS